MRDLAILNYKRDANVHPCRNGSFTSFKLPIPHIEQGMASITTRKFPHAFGTASCRALRTLWDLSTK